MPTRDVNLTDRHGLRLLEQRAAEEKAKLDWPGRAAEEGFGALDRGERIEVADEDLDVYLAELGRHTTGSLENECDAA